MVDYSRKLYIILRVTLVGIMFTSQTVSANSLSLFEAKYNRPSVKDTGDKKLLVRSWLSFAFERAESSVYEAAYTIQDYNLSQKILSVYKVMPELKITWPDKDENDVMCVKNYPAMAYVLLDQKIIGICHSAIYEFSKESISYMAQILIHEAAHLAGFETECSATKIEVEVAKNSKLGLQFKNTYWAQCGISDNI